MAKADDRIAIGIGPQVDQTTPLAAVRDATNLIVGAATGTDATGILLREDSDLSQSMNRIESDGGTCPGSLSRVSGQLIRIEPSVSFTIDAMGSRDGPITPSIGEYDFPEYFEQILSGARLNIGTSDATVTEYNFGSTANFKTVKIWRDVESWTLVGCTFNLTWNFVAGEKATIDVEVVADSVIYNPADTYPTNDTATAYGNQCEPAPILELATSTLLGPRGFSSGSISIAYSVNQIGDSNVTGGTLNSQGTPRDVTWEMVYFRDTADDDFDLLTDNLDSGSPGPQIGFTLGQIAGAGDIVNSQKYVLRSFRAETEDEVIEDGAQIRRTISGYAAVAGGGAINSEFVISSV